MIRNRVHESGQGQTEYALILAGLVIVAAIALGLMGKQIISLFDLMGQTPKAASAGSPLGSNFTDISDNMINLIMDFYRRHNRWPRSWGDYAYSDLGLNPADWTKPHDGIIYKPGGSRLAIGPAEGYTFEVTGTDGKIMRMPSSYHWNLVYNMNTGTWHHKSVDGPAIQIKTLKVIPPSPKPG